MDHSEPHWWTNSSFSPPSLRLWDFRLHSDGLPQGSHAAGAHGSSLPSNSKGSRRRVVSKPYAKHHHSVSDGALSYSGSPTDNIRAPRWTSPVRKFKVGEFCSSSVQGSTSDATWFPCSTERRHAARVTAESPSFGSPSSLSELYHWKSTVRQRSPFPYRNHSSRRTQSKAVYPLMFHNPVSDGEAFGGTDVDSFEGFTPGGMDWASASNWPDNSSSEHKFHKALTELHKLETSPDPSASSRREGFRWSSSSSYDIGFDGEEMDVESRRSPIGPVADQKCGVCGKFLWQKSPWSSRRMMRGGDMPTAGVLPCSHMFHAECLEQVTPKTEIRCPPCPMCSKTIGSMEESPSVSQPLQMALRSVRRSRGVVISEAQEGHENDEAGNRTKDRLRRNWSRAFAKWNGSSSLKNHLKSHFSYKGKASKDILSANLLCRGGPSSSSSRDIV
ncbi:hypothetical protein HS088_TW23G00432 [Tripterygium wilfordii]|uniref:RING-type domain-containing protein n=1 Tax=Tripterygium wilfordii TaxID=458696 RepID=A0A7J7BVJ9_TRIWF|nr:uncharacterized protein LOC119992836 [Tripterygium wilfordii]XP_038695553.1 uncharacterized protein LOC119992836 [Tripterygium wilfordii]KAF5725705.1 hypothetical protein HS088_TW23G00432 [Tripterygium wilfordii]